MQSDFGLIKCVFEKISLCLVCPPRLTSSKQSMLSSKKDSTQHTLEFILEWIEEKWIFNLF